MKVSWFSTGVSSFVACYLTKDIDKIMQDCGIACELALEVEE